MSVQIPVMIPDPLSDLSADELYTWQATLRTLSVIAIPGLLRIIDTITDELEYRGLPETDPSEGLTF